MSLFSWLKSFFVSPSYEESIDVYRPEERLLYSYWNGTELVRCDPIQLYKRMMAKGPELSIDIKVAQSKSKDAVKAHDSMIKTIREIFSLKPMEEGGLSEIETIELLDHFMRFSDIIKKNSSPSTIFAEGQSGNSEPTKAEPPPTSSSLHSGSLEKEDSIETPPSSPTEPELPKEQSPPESTTSGQ